MRAFLPVTFALLLAATAHAAPEPRMKTLMSFEDGADEPRWVAVNDGVMGGRSQGGPEVARGLLRFSGVLSLENNGGFSSARTLVRDFDFSGADALVLRVRGDGRRYQLRLATDASYRGITVSWGSEFPTVAGQWTEVRVPLAELRPSVRGVALQGPPMDPSRVRELGLLLGDKREGPFQLEVDWIGLE